jgi:glycosyltransferase involved in cell wall biosynthesis
LHGPDEFIPGLVLWYMPSKWFINDSRSLDTLTLMGKFVYVGHRYLYMPLYIAILKGTVYLAPSKYMQSVAEKDLYPVLHLPNGIESKKFYTYKSGGPILFVGRLEKVKGIDYLIDAMVIVHKLCPNAKLVVIGSGAHEFEAHEKIRAYHLEDCIKFVGWIARKKIDDYYKKCSMLVIPSVWPEISGNVITEAMYIGRPVVATRVGGIPEIVKNNHNGLLVPAKNSESLAEAIMKVFIDKEMAEKMGRNAHEDVKKLNFDIHTKKLLEIYKKIIAGEY